MNPAKALVTSVTSSVSELWFVSKGVINVKHALANQSGPDNPSSAYAQD